MTTQCELYEEGAFSDDSRRHDDGVPCLKQGYFGLDDGTVGYAWAVFDLSVAEAEAGDPADRDFAQRLTGWSYSYSGAGRFFADEPTARVYGKKVLVKQRRGLDI